MKKLARCFLCLLFCFSVISFTACNKSNIDFKLYFCVDDSIYSVITTNGHDVISIPENPTKVGYTFDGWYWDKDYWQRPFNTTSLLSEPLNSNMSVFAHFIKNNALSGTDINIKTSIKVNLDGFGEVFFLTVSNNQIFFKFDDYIEINSSSNYTVSKNIEGTQIIPNKSVELPVGNNLYYIYVTDKNNKHESYVVSIYRNHIYNIYFNSNGGTSCATVSIEEDEILNNVPISSKTGYTFAGWDYDFANKIENDVYVNAKWTPNKYIVTYNINGGNELQYNTQTLTYGESYTLVTPTKLGYDFVGWYYNETKVNSSKWNIAEDCELVAHWTPKTNTRYQVLHYQENINNSDYTLFETETLYGTTDANVTPNVKTYNSFTAPSAQIIKVTPDGNAVVKYYYNRNNYTITFVSNGGSEVQSVTQKYNSSVDSSIKPIRENYTFENWYTDIDLTNTFNYKIPANNLTVYAYWSEETKPNNLKYSLNNNFYRITGCNGTPSTLCIPKYIGGKPVTNISNSAFSNCSSLTSITIPSNVESIGNIAFSGCSSLTSVTFGENSQLTSIGRYAFEDCSSLTSVTFGENSQLTSIGRYAFEDCSSLTSITFGENSQLTSIGEYAFYNCSSLTSVTFGENSQLTSIGEYAFYNCSSLTDVYYDGTLSDWCKISFSTYYSNPMYYTSSNKIKHFFIKNSNSEYEELTEIEIPIDITKIKSYTFYGFNNVTKVIIPSSVTSIGYNAFGSCSSLKSIEIPASVTSIDGSAFSSCSSLTSITIPSSVTSIGYEAFYGCSSLTSIVVEDDNENYKSINGNLYTKDGKTLIQYAIGKTATTFVVPSIVTSIGERAFYNCSNLTSVVIPNGVTSIGYEAFYNCSSLTSIIFENPNGWSAGKTSFTSSSLLDSSAAAYYLIMQYYYCIWTRS